MTAIHAALAGRLLSVRAKPVAEVYERGRAIGMVEGVKYFGPIRTPVRARLLAVNDSVLHNPKVLSEDPYRDGWFGRLQPVNWPTDRRGLAAAREAASALETQIRALRVHCFAAFPDYEMVEIGTECAAVLVKLNELLDRMENGEVVHIVSDDWTAPIEMERWAEEQKQPVIESRREGNLYHFLVRKAV